VSRAPWLSGNLRCRAPRGHSGRRRVRRAGCIEDWNGELIETVSTSGGTVLVCDPCDALMRPTSGAWPPPALVMRLGEGEPSRGGGFSDELREQVPAPLGHYCALLDLDSSAIAVPLRNTISRLQMTMPRLVLHALSESWNV
jgi:hypothetical protein